MSGRHLCLDLSAEEAALLDNIMKMVLRASTDPELSVRITDLAAKLSGGDERPEGCALAKMAFGGVAPGESLNIDGALNVGPALRQMRDLVGGGRVLRVALVAHIEPTQEDPR